MENKELIDRAIGYIQQNPKENLSLQSIADSAGFSLNYFDAIFRLHTGYSPVEYSRVYKLTRSALELRRTDRRIIDIALDFGYASPESYSRAFRNFYGVSPGEYREKYSQQIVTWHDLSGRIAISHFRHCFPKLKIADMDAALDYCFTHNPLRYAEDIIGMTVADTEILTLGDPIQPGHFIYVSDYNSVEPEVTLVCGEETDAIAYLTYLSEKGCAKFSVRKPVEREWSDFDAKAAQLGLTCRCGYDMIYPRFEISIPEYDGMLVRELSAQDMTFVRSFRQKGCCSECHVRAIQNHFNQKGNDNLRPIGLFADGELLCLAMPVLDTIRELRKYDIGAIFTSVQPESDLFSRSVELIWKFTIDLCLRDGASVGNANAVWDADSPLGAEMSERIGLIKSAKNCTYSK